VHLLRPLHQELLDLGMDAKKTGYTLFLGGTLGKKPRLGTKAKALIETKEELLGHVENAFQFYLPRQEKERFGHP